MFLLCKAFWSFPIVLVVVFNLIVNIVLSRVMPASRRGI